VVLVADHHGVGHAVKALEPQQGVLQKGVVVLQADELLGYNCLDRGQSRVPEPPARMMGMIMGVGVRPALL